MSTATRAAVRRHPLVDMSGCQPMDDTKRAMGLPVYDRDPWDDDEPARPRRRARRRVENDDYMAFVARIIRAGRARIAQADPHDLAGWVRMRDELDQAIGDAVRAQQAAGFSWADIAAPLGISRQAAYKRWGKP